MRSLFPSRLLVDTELHTFSAMRWRHSVLSDDVDSRVAASRNYISAALGRGGQLTWLWGRNRNGVGLSPHCTPATDVGGADANAPNGFVESTCDKQAGWFALSILQSPRALHAHARSTLLLQVRFLPSPSLSFHLLLPASTSFSLLLLSKTSATAVGALRRLWPPRQRPPPHLAAALAAQRAALHRPGASHHRDGGGECQRLPTFDPLQAT